MAASDRLLVRYPLCGAACAFSTASTDRYNRRCCARDSLALQGEADADGKTNQNSRSRQCKVSRRGLPQCRRPWQRRSRPQSRAKHRHVAAILHRISGWFSKTSTRCGSPPRPALGDCHVHSSPCAHPIRHMYIAHSACHSCMRLCAAHPAQPSTLYMLRGGSPITEQTSGADDRYGAGELMVTLATRSTAAGPVTMGSRQHSPTDTRGS